jgi:hypothetical protein
MMPADKGACARCHEELGHGQVRVPVAIGPPYGPHVSLCALCGRVYVATLRAFLEHPLDDWEYRAGDEGTTDGAKR